MQISAGHQILQLCGALLILLAYAGHQLDWMDAWGWKYNVLNGAGSAILGVYAVWPRPQYGFIVLEFAWVAISLYGLARAMRRERTSASH